MFKQLETTIARWAPPEGKGLEHLHLSRNDDAIIANGTVIGARGGVPYGATYQVICSPDWQMRAFQVSLADGRSLHMHRDDAGHWRFDDGRAAPEFNNCIDIDLAATPFTNTLPIRRAGLRQNDAREFNMLYVPFDSLTPRTDRQRYTCLSEGKLYRYEATDRSFSADLPVDEHGLVINYPTLFQRVA